MSTYKATIGLEIHAELQTRTKMFCACLNNPDEREPNKNICAVCLAHPGTLPVINKEAVHKVLSVGTAVNGTLARTFSEFDRKNYFYPDIPKGYQISQYKYPLVLGGMLNGVEITRIHLEEDTARSQHPSTGSGQDSVSLVDYNRAGVPLMELVTEPVIHDAQTAGAFARELQLLLRYLRAGEANMEKGEMRVEANVSVAPVQGSTLDQGSTRSNLVLGTKVEVKNLNSFRSVERAIEYEIKRQTEVLEKGEKVTQETRGWDEVKQVTFSQRKKESSHDYRYFPDPDLPKLVLGEIPEFSAEVLTKELPELPEERRARYIALGLKVDDADMFVNDLRFGIFFESVIAEFSGVTELIKITANYIASDLAGLIKNLPEKASQGITILPAQFSKLVNMIYGGQVSSRGAKDILMELFMKGGDPEVIAKEKGLMQQSDTGALAAIAQKIIEANPAVVADYKAGKEAAMQFLVGQGMRESKGSANPAALKEAFLKLLSV